MSWVFYFWPSSNVGKLLVMATGRRLPPIEGIPAPVSVIVLGPAVSRF